MIRIHLKEEERGRGQKINTNIKRKICTNEEQRIIGSCKNELLKIRIRKKMKVISMAIFSFSFKIEGVKLNYMHNNLKEKITHHSTHEFGGTRG
jgi:hypothetical protein